MDKKDYILKLLEQLKDTWPMATGLKILVEGNSLSDNSIEWIIQIIETAIQEVKEDEKKEKLSKWAEFLKKLQNIESTQQSKEQKELWELDQMLLNL